MATTDKRLDISELDFDDIKTNLKTFLISDSEVEKLSILMCLFKNMAEILFNNPTLFSV